jgi:signal transduction histidine kinase
LLLSQDVKVFLFESIRELLFNTVKHAQVDSAAVDVEILAGKVVQITVSDRGLGFDPAGMSLANELGGSFGLFSIHERLGLIGGQLTIESSPGKGSRFVLAVPLAGQTEAANPVVPGRALQP